MVTRTLRLAAARCKTCSNTCLRVTIMTVLCGRNGTAAGIGGGLVVLVLGPGCPDPVPLHLNGPVTVNRDGDTFLVTVVQHAAIWVGDVNFQLLGDSLFRKKLQKPSDDQTKLRTKFY